MKTTKFFMVVLLFFGLTGTANAQFLNQLKKRIIDKTTDAVVETAADKVARKAADKTADIVDDILDANMEGIVGPIGKMKDVGSLPSSYNFDYKYSLNATMDKHEAVLDYYLSKSEPYFGMSMNVPEGGDVFMIFDESNSAMVTIMAGNAFATELKFDADDIDNSDFDEKYTVTSLPGKKFLGFDCEGRLIESSENAITLYFAPNIGSGFWNIFKNNQQKMPPEMKKLGAQYENGLMMYMQVNDKTGKSQNATIECIAFDQSKKSVSVR